MTKTQAPLVVIESPYAGEAEANVEYARRCLRDSLKRGEYPIASHLLYTQPGVLDDTDPAERELGMAAGFAWNALAAATIVCMDRGMSQGMLQGIRRAQAEGRRVVYRWLDRPEWASGGVIGVVTEGYTPRMGEQVGCRAGALGRNVIGGVIDEVSFERVLPLYPDEAPRSEHSPDCEGHRHRIHCGSVTHRDGGHSLTADGPYAQPWYHRPPSTDPDARACAACPHDEDQHAGTADGHPCYGGTSEDRCPCPQYVWPMPAREVREATKPIYERTTPDGIRSRWWRGLDLRRAARQQRVESEGGEPGGVGATALPGLTDDTATERVRKRLRDQGLGNLIGDGAEEDETDC